MKITFTKVGNVNVAKLPRSLELTEEVLSSLYDAQPKGPTVYVCGKHEPTEGFALRKYRTRVVSVKPSPTWFRARQTRAVIAQPRTSQIVRERRAASARGSQEQQLAHAAAATCKLLMDIMSVYAACRCSRTP